MLEKEEILKGIALKNEVIFKKIFGKKGNENLLKIFLESILETQIESLTVDLDRALSSDILDENSSRFVVNAKLSDGKNVIIEIRTNISEFSEEESLASWCELYSEQFEVEDDYETANKVISIWIVNDKAFDFSDYHSIWKIGEVEKGRTEHFDDFEIHVIDLEKLRIENILEPKNKEFWLWFIDHTNMALVDMACSLPEIRKVRAEYEKIIEETEFDEK